MNISFSEFKKKERHGTSFATQEQAVQDYRNAVIDYTDSGGNHIAFTVQDISLLIKSGDELEVYLSGAALVTVKDPEVQEEILLKYEDAHGTALPEFHDYDVNNGDKPTKVF